MSVRLHIERLVVDGVDLGPGGGRRLQASVEAELTRLMAGEELGAPVSSAALPHLAVRPIALDSHPARLGIQVARTLYEGLKPEGVKR